MFLVEADLKEKRPDNSKFLNLELPTSLKQVQLSLVGFNSHRVMQHEDIKSKMDDLKSFMTPEAARRNLKDWEVFSSSLAH